jgi:hypothetical protein
VAAETRAQGCAAVVVPWHSPPRSRAITAVLRATATLAPPSLRLHHSHHPRLSLRSDRTTLNGAGWVDLGNPSNDATTFDSQSTFILPYTHADGHKTLVYMGDRWNADGPGGLKNSSYIWCVARPR